MRALLTHATALVLLAAGFIPTMAATRPDSVDLGANQTPIRKQGSRTTCIVFAATAALEAAYHGAGYGELDLSEEFLNHFGKMLWLEPRLSRVQDRGEDGREGQVGAFAGGDGVQYLERLANGLRVTTEAAMPYHPRNFTAQDHPYLANKWNSSFWTQRRSDDVNFDVNFLPAAALRQPLYYSVKNFTRIKGNDPNAIEAALAQSKEVVWDFHVAGNRGQGATIWTTCTPGQERCLKGTSHAMLLIGYDRRDPDPSKHYFLVKNSWGPTQWPDGYTRISYDYLRSYGNNAGYINEINRPGPWPELAFIGRWNFKFEGHKGILDIYHIPGIAQWLLDQKGGRIRDLRIGSFYDENGKAYRVNGRMTGDHIEFFINPSNPFPPYDQIAGRRFAYSNNEMTSKLGRVEVSAAIVAARSERPRMLDPARTARFVR
jgi:hypothetical protein